MMIGKDQDFELLVYELLNRIEVNIQRNTTVYNPAADTVIVEYVVKDRW